jgi:heterokaryon incompatibility protein (HET)
MRLLTSTDAGNFILTEPFSEDDDIPPYTMLSHTWGKEDDEITFEDLKAGRARTKPAGYRKLEFCRTQTANSGLKYFWIDTCCINKADPIELQQAINSMYRWYRDAATCYVYMSDVSAQNDTSDRGSHARATSSFRASSLFKRGRTLQEFIEQRRQRKSSNESVRKDTSDRGRPSQYELTFQGSRWFKRGWTLQELLAPSSVEFFSENGVRLGDKSLLQQEIHNVTGIPIKALQGCSLSEYTVEERFSWAKHRETKYKEDKAYSLQGIFDVCIPLLYGEGEDRAFARLKEEINKRQNQEEMSTKQQDTNNNYISGKFLIFLAALSYSTLSKNSS